MTPAASSCPTARSMGTWTRRWAGSTTSASCATSSITSAFAPTCSARACRWRSITPRRRRWRGTSSIASPPRASTCTAPSQRCGHRPAVHAHSHPPQQGGRLAAQQRRFRRHRDLAGRPGLCLRQHLRQSRRLPQLGSRDDPDTENRFGHAYYLDGAFKNYYFNNIAWGKSKDPAGTLANTSAFQEIISYQNTFFNNTIYNFVRASRRQAPQAGRDKFLGNIWEGMGLSVFRHADPARTAAGNEADAGPRRGHFALETDAYARNVFHDFGLSEGFGVLEPSGRWLLTLRGVPRCPGQLPAAGRERRRHGRAAARCATRPPTTSARPPAPLPAAWARRSSCPGACTRRWPSGTSTPSRATRRASWTNTGACRPTTRRGRLLQVPHLSAQGRQCHAQGLSGRPAGELDHGRPALQRQRPIRRPGERGHRARRERGRPRAPGSAPSAART